MKLYAVMYHTPSGDNEQLVGIFTKEKLIELFPDAKDNLGFDQFEWIGIVDNQTGNDYHEDMFSLHVHSGLLNISNDKRYGKELTVDVEADVKKKDNSRGLYSWSASFGRMGSLEGLFIATKEAIEKLIGKYVYFGEILGKHSDIDCTIDRDQIVLISEDQEKLDWLVKIMDNHTISGTNPFDYITCYGCGELESDCWCEEENDNWCDDCDKPTDKCECEYSAYIDDLADYYGMQELEKKSKELSDEEKMTDNEWKSHALEWSE